MEASASPPLTCSPAPPPPWSPPKTPLGGLPTPSRSPCPPFLNVQVPALRHAVDTGAVLKTTSGFPFFSLCLQSVLLLCFGQTVTWQTLDPDSGKTRSASALWSAAPGPPATFAAMAFVVITCLRRTMGTTRCHEKCFFFICNCVPLGLLPGILHNHRCYLNRFDLRRRGPRRKPK